MRDTRRPGPPRPPARHVLVRRYGHFPGRLRVDKLDDVEDALRRLLGDDEGA